MINLDNDKRVRLSGNAHRFVEEHRDYCDEKQQAQMWLRDLFTDVFEINKLKVNVGFEHKVKGGYIDHLFNGLLLTEMKSMGKDLEVAKEQAFNYVMDLSNKDVPTYVMVSDFKYIVLYDLKKNTNFKFLVEDLPQYIELFNFFYGEEVIAREPQSPVNVKAAKELERLHDKLRELKYPKNSRSLFMTRIVFCMFADDTGIFEKNQFRNYILNETNEDGTDLIYKLLDLFIALDTPYEDRVINPSVENFRYINGGLFKVKLEGVPLNREARNMLIRVTELDWSMISPIIFGSMFEGAMDSESRHDLGAHFTSETNIMKVISSLFLEELRTEFDKILNYKVDRLKRLQIFHKKISNLKFLDPACGSGNFLLLAYREIRRLEHDVIQAELREEYIRDNNISLTNFNRKIDINYQDTLFTVEDRIKVEVAQFYGIEIQAYAVSIAKLSLWLMDHLMNLEASNKFGQQVLRLPLHAGANIHVADALLINWNDIIDCRDLDYILGNPPFNGKSSMLADQKNSLAYAIADKVKKYKSLDFVAAWYIKAGELMIINHSIKTALVSTNSIIQGEQAPILWSVLFNSNIHISFAHQTFDWDNNGAKVHVVIIGTSYGKTKNPKIYVYNNLKGEPTCEEAIYINEYLINANPVLLKPRTVQISGFPEMGWGSKLTDGGNFLFNQEEKNEIIKKYPFVNDYLHLYLSAKDLLNNGIRYALYLKYSDISKVRHVPEINSRILAIKEMREKSSDKTTNKDALRPMEYQQDHVIIGDYLAIPRVSSSKRDYIPMDFLSYPTIVSDALFQVKATPFEFAILQSKIHMLWIRTVCGRLKSDIRYSNTLGYNNFIVPKVSTEMKKIIDDLGKLLIDCHKHYKSNNMKLADIYDPLYMPKDLRTIHIKIDQVVDSIYKKSGFSSDNERLQCLLNLYHNETLKQ